MKEMLLNAILNLFALTAAEAGGRKDSRYHQVVEQYLTTQLRLTETEHYSGLFDELYDFALDMDSTARKRMLWTVCQNLQGKLPRQDQIIALMNLLLLLTQGAPSGEIPSLGMIIAGALDIEGGLYDSLVQLVMHPADHQRLGPDFVILDQSGHLSPPACRVLRRPDFKAGFTLLSLPETSTLFLVPTGEGQLTIDRQPAAKGRFYVIEPGTILHDAFGAPCYFSEIMSALSGEAKVADGLVFTGDELDFRFPGSENGLHRFSFGETSGRLAGVMGGSGTGKSTLLSILSGTLPPDSGRILINGLDMYRQKRALEGVIGFVPQDDLLFNDLTVYQNLYYSARLCLANLDDGQIRARVERTLTELGQAEIKDLKVGSPLEKTISGGQRKRLNIALELIREPGILFADEPTSGLSSADSLNVISLLKEQALKGRLVIVVIHQPSSAIFKLFDSLWVLDKGGRPVFAGNPIEALTYFRGQADLAGQDHAVCPVCGNVNPEQIFDILEMQAVDEGGRFTGERLITPQQWHQCYQERCADQIKPDRPEEASPPPRRLFKPSAWGQFRIFFKRNLLARLANRQYVLINLLEAPVIALVLALLCRFSPGDEYIFMENRNISMFFFMSVIVTIFLGLSVSAEEIIKDRTILKREGFLKLSWNAYLNSKTGFVAILIAIQTLGFILVALPILEIPDMALKFWAMLFSCGVCAGLIGLNISASLRSVVAIYILVPLLLIPQMLLSGSVINFNDLISSGASNNRVPWYANAMPSRWAYEGLLAEQYNANAYQREISQTDCRIRQIDYLLDSYLPELKSLAAFKFLKAKVKDKQKLTERNLLVLRNELPEVQRLTGLPLGLEPASFEPRAFDRAALKKVKKYLNQAAGELRKQRTAWFKGKKALEKKRLARLGREGVNELKKRHANKSIAQAARNSLGMEALRISGGRLIQLDVPVCKPARSNWGMAHFPAGWKQVAGYRIETYYYNLAFLWFISLILYLCLHFKLLPRMLGSDPTN